VDQGEGRGRYQYQQAKENPHGCRLLHGHTIVNCWAVASHADVPSGKFKPDTKMPL
jgi:hypothetical protein